MKIFNKILFGVGIAAIIWLIFYGMSEGIKENEPSNVAKILTAKGFTHIKIGDYAMWCAKGIPVRRHFSAIDSKGQAVTGKICDHDSDSTFFLFTLGNVVDVTPIKNTH